MIQRQLSQKGSAQLFIVIILVAAIIGFLGYVVWQKISTAPKTNTDGTNQSRDDERKKQAKQFASSLFSIHLLLGQTPSSDQQGLDSITVLENDQQAIDPLTKKPYVFTNDQSTMKVGEAFFKLNATCDNKISGSDNKGLIIDASDKSVAVNLRLESGTYACETNL
jgi:hypothetical protein